MSPNSSVPSVTPAGEESYLRLSKQEVNISTLAESVCVTERQYRIICEGSADAPGRIKAEMERSLSQCETIPISSSFHKE